MPLRFRKVVALTAVGLMVGATSAAAATDFKAPCTTSDATCLAQRLTAVEAWIEANDTDVPVTTPTPTPTPTRTPTSAPTPAPTSAPTPTPTPTPTKAPTPAPTPSAPVSTVWDATVTHSGGKAGTGVPVTVKITAPSGTTQTGKVLNVEAHIGGVKKSQVFVENTNLTGTTTHNLTLPALPAGEYQIVVMVFDGGWGPQRFLSTEGPLVVTPGTVATPPPGPVGTPVGSPSTALWDNFPKPADAHPAGQFDILKSTPMSIWFAGGNADSTRTQARQAVTAANGKIVSFIMYNIPGRDGNNYSAGGVANLAEYRAYVNGAAEGIGSAPAIITIEPDALGLFQDLSAEKRTERLEAMKYAVQRFSQNPNAQVYVDAAQWVGAAEMAALVKSTVPAGGKIAGFTVNVSGYESTTAMIDYSNRLIAASGQPWKAIIDTSRNGVATATHWCNPRGQGLGKLPTLNTGVPNIAAYLWLKGPGESDGECNGGPSAGTFWPEIANEQIRNAQH